MPKHTNLKRYQPFHSPRPAIRKKPRDANMPHPGSRLSLLVTRYRRDEKLKWADAIALAKLVIAKRGATWGVRRTYGVPYGEDVSN